MRIPFEKSIARSVYYIDNFQKEAAFKLIDNGHGIKDSNATIGKDANGNFVAKLLLNKRIRLSREILKVLDELIFERNEQKYFVRKNTIQEFTASKSSPQLITHSLTHLQSGFDECYNNKKLRLIIPVESEPNFNIIESNDLKINTTLFGSSLVEISVDNKIYHLFKYTNSDSKSKYLIIDCIEETNFNDFKATTDAIIIALGYLSGNLFLGNYFYLAFDNKKLEVPTKLSFEKREDSVYTGIPLLDPSKFKEYVKEINEEEKYGKTPARMHPSVFSNLCSTIKKNETFGRCCTLIIEGNQSKQLLLQAGIYSIALETITNIIYEEQIDKIDPLTDKNISKNIKKDLKAVIEKYNKEISSYGMQILDSKINDFDRATNTKKLSVPFEIYKIKLSKEDIDILNHRNKFLHGTAPFKEQELKNKDNELRIITWRFHFMLNSLILKYIGYSGHIINYAGWWQYENEEEITHHLFRVI